MTGRKTGGERILTERLARVATRLPWWTVAVWAVVVLAGAAAFAIFGDALVASDDFVGKPEGKRVEALVAERFPGTDADTEVVVVSSPDLTVDDGAFLLFVGDLARQIRALGPGDITSVLSYVDVKAMEGLQGSAPPADEIPKLVSDDRHTAILLVQLAGSASEADKHMDDLYPLVTGQNGKEGYFVAITGSAAWETEAHDLAGSDLTRGELIGAPIAFVILLLVFGTLVAAVLPLGLAFLAVVIGSALTALLGQGFQVSVFAINIVTMMGLAVGIDYSLLIVSRFREERAAGRSRDDAVARTGATAGRAVLFSGGTVVLALTGMLVVPFTIFTSLGAGAILVVVVAVAAALTLLPAVLHLMGNGVNRLRIPLPERRHAGRGDEPDGFWAGAARRIMRRPIISLALGGGLLLALAIPAFDMQRGIPGVEQMPERLSTRRAFTVLQREFSAGLSSPILITVQGPLEDPKAVDAMAALERAVETDGRFELVGTETTEDTKLALVKVAVNEDAASEAATQAVRDLRTEVLPPAVEGAPVEVMVGGVPGLYTDAVELVDLYTPIVIGLVLAMSFVLLLFAFRSLVIAAKAVLMNLLSVGAAFGAITIVFQKGHLAGLLGFQQVDSVAVWLPLMLFCVLFGLSMDYQVFLLSRVREEYDRSGDTTRAVVFGLSSTAGLITGAALIMVAVFGGVASGELMMFQQLGFGLAVAVALDASVVRTVVVPSAMAILGRWNWYLPRWLEWLPQVTVGEGAAPATEATDERSDQA